MSAGGRGDALSGAKKTEQVGGRDGGENWKRKHEYGENQLGILQLALSYDETYLIGTFMDGFLLWNAQEGQGTQVITLKLPRSIRNVTVKMNKSNECILSKSNIWAIAGVRKVL